MNSNRIWFFGLLAVSGLYLLYLILGTGPTSRPPLGTFELGPSDMPLFAYEDPYYSGRSRWMAKQFEVARVSLPSLAVPIQPFVAADVHPEPFTAGDWVESLDETQKKFRAEAERNAMDTQAIFFVPGAQPRKLALFLGCSGFLENVGKPGEYEHSVFFDPASEAPRESEKSLEFRGAQFLTLETWTGGALAKPTSVYYRNEIARSGEVVVLVYEFWSNSPVEGAAEVLFAGGQFALREIDGGTMVLLRSFFRGQSFSSWLKGFAISETKKFYVKYVGVIQSMAARWHPDERVTSWARRVGWMER